MSETKKKKKEKQKSTKEKEKEKEKEKVSTDSVEEKDAPKKEPEIKITVSSSPSLRPLAPEFKPSKREEKRVEEKKTADEQKVEENANKKEEKIQNDKSDPAKSKIEHSLETPWTFYFDKKLAKQATIDYNDFQQNLHKLGVVTSLESFWRMYCYLASPELIPKDCDLFLFRSSYVPAWESFPNGGCWIIKVRKRNGVINRLWEELLFATIGEQFDEPDLVGIELSTRGREDMLSVWNRDNLNPNIRFRIGERLKEILNLDESTQIEYKYFSHSLRDGSTFRNAKAYVYAATHSPAQIPQAAVEH